MAASYLGDMASEAISLSTVSATITGSNATNPIRGCYVGRGDGPVTVQFSFGTIHADTTGTFTIVESATNANGSWTEVSSVGYTSLAITTSDSNLVRLRTIYPSKPYIGVLYTMAGATISAHTHVLINRNEKYN